MGWTIFTAVDLVLGLLFLDLVAPTLPPEKAGRVRVARRIVLGSLAVTAVVLVVQIVRR